MVYNFPFFTFANHVVCKLLSFRKLCYLFVHYTFDHDDEDGREKRKDCLAFDRPVNPIIIRNKQQHIISIIIVVK